MSIASEFKAFVLRGNVVDLAVGVIIGASFGGIVTSVVEDVLMPPIGWVIDGVDFTGLSVKLPAKKDLLEGKITSAPAEPKEGEKKADAKPAEEPKKTDAKPPEKEKVAEIKYGNFIQKTISFTITAFCLFMIVKAMNRMKRKEDAKPAEPTAEQKLLAEIRDELRKK